MQARAITALITPYDERGDIDLEALDRLIAFQLEAKTEGILFCGSTGEGSLLTREEKLAIFHRGVEQAKGATEILASVGSCSTQKSVDLAKDAENLGVDSLLAIVPYYVKPTATGCVRHFEAIAQVGLPLIAYHHPGRTGTRLPLEVLLEIAAIEGVVGIKDCSEDLELVSQLSKEGVRVYSGDDPLCLSQLKQGIYGSISITGNIVPDLWKEAVESHALSLELKKLIEALLLETNPQCVKYAASLLGLCRPDMRLPLHIPLKANRETVTKALQTAGLALQ